MPISFIGLSTATTSSGASGITISVPSGTLAGDLLLAQITVVYAGVTVTPPSGWSALRNDFHDTSADGRTWLFYRIAGASEPSSYTFSYSGSTVTYSGGAITCWRGCDTTTPIEAHALNRFTTSVSQVTHPDVAIGGADRLVLRIVGMDSWAGLTFGSEVTERYDFSGDLSQCRLALGDGAPASSSQAGESVTTLSLSREDIVAYTVVLAPASSPTEQLSATAIGASAVSASLEISRLLSGAAIGSGRMAAVPSVARLLAGEARGEGMLVGNVDSPRLLSGTAIGSSGLQGAVTVERLLAGAAIGEGAMAVELLPGSVALAAAAVGSGFLQGTLVVERLLAATAIGTSSLAGTVSVERLLAGAASGEGAMTGAVVVTRDLAGRAVGEGALRGELLVWRLLSGAMAGEGVLVYALAQPIAGIGIGLGEAVAIQAVTAVGVGVGLGEAVVSGVLAVEAVGLGLGNGLALIELPAQALVLTTGVRLEPGDLVWLVAPLAGVQGRTGLCRVLTVEHDPDRGERRYRVQLIRMATADDMPAMNELWRPRAAIDRTTNLVRQLREAQRG